jgi:group I intron endonuclease
MAHRTRGVYAITCIPNGRRYIGSSGNVKARWAQHRSELRHGKHLRSELQADWDAYGAQAFEFTFLQSYSSEEERHSLEQQYMDEAKALGLAYNSAPRADGNTGMKHTAATRAKVGAASRAAVRTDEWRRHASESQQGRILTDSHREKISDRKRGSGNQNAKLTEDDVREIKKRLAAGEMGGVIAKDFNVDQSVVGKIKQGRRWTHVTI